LDKTGLLIPGGFFMTSNNIMDSINKSIKNQLQRKISLAQLSAANVKKIAKEKENREHHHHHHNLNDSANTPSNENDTSMLRYTEKQ
jgi:hypothetical protein